MLRKLKKWLGFGGQTVEQISESARHLIVFASDNLAQLFEDSDGNGLPDIAERAARYAAQIVGALEIIHGHTSGAGAIKIKDAMQEVMAASRNGLIVWNLAKPYIEAAVNLLPRKRGV